MTMLFKALLFVAIACVLAQQIDAQWYGGYAAYPGYAAYSSYYPTYAGYYGGLYTGLSYPGYAYYGWGSNKGGAPDAPTPAGGSLTNNVRQ